MYDADAEGTDDDDEASDEGEGDTRREGDMRFVLPALMVQEVLPPHDTEESQRLQEIAARHHANARDNAAPPLRATRARLQAMELAATEETRRNDAGVAASREWLAGLARAHAHHGPPIGRGRGAGH